MGFRIYNTTDGILVERDGRYHMHDAGWDTLVNDDDLFMSLAKRPHGAFLGPEKVQVRLKRLLPPVGSQEVWAAGVTYYRSRDARVEESKAAGGGGFYERVYEAERPELFFKSSAARVVGPGGAVRIREDSTWDVPEPELTLFIAASGKVVGYTVGNDMSSRSIEGENPLYLPQAKVYDGSAALGPCLYVPEEPLAPSTQIEIEIRRGGAPAFTGSIGIDQMKRGHDELAGWLFRANAFSHGCYLMTGTGIVPPDGFTLRTGDEVRITIAPIGTLVNVVG
jgi:2-dehydro-3-deoxy-D-arabinonate dehydratase